MRTLVICDANIQAAPYVLVYLNLLLDYHCEVDYAYWDRTGDNLPYLGINNVYRFDKTIDNSMPKIFKIRYFLGFRKFLLKVLKNKQYDCVIIFDTKLLMLLKKTLLKYYRKKFVYDMRDLSFEKNFFYRNEMNKLSNASIVTSISSDGFRQFFKKQDNVLTLYNFQSNDLNHIGFFRKKKASEKISIFFWGFLRDLKLYLSLVDGLANSKKIDIWFYGVFSREMLSLQEYCKNRGYANIFFGGKYSQEQRYAFAKKADLLINIFENNFKNSNPIMSNKYYDGVFFRIPQICIRDSFMGELVRKQEVGFVERIENITPTNLINYYFSIDEKRFNEKCELLLNEIKSNHNSSLGEIARLLNLKK